MHLNILNRRTANLMSYDQIQTIEQEETVEAGYQPQEAWPDCLLMAQQHQLQGLLP